MSDYSYLAEINDFAKSHGYKIQKLSTVDRHNRKGDYHYVELELVVPAKTSRKLEDTIHELETELEKEEVNNNEI